MKKLIIILLVAASAIAGAATLSSDKKVEVEKVTTVIPETQVIKSSVMATWD